MYPLLPRHFLFIHKDVIGGFYLHSAKDNIIWKLVHDCILYLLVEKIEYDIWSTITQTKNRLRAND